MGLTVRVPGKRQSIYMSIFCCLSWQRLAYWASGYEGSLTPVKGKQNIQIKVVGPRLLLLQNSQFLRRWTSHKVWCSHRSRRTRVVQRHKLAQSCLHWGQLWSYPSFLSFSQLKYRCCALSHVWLFVTPWTVAHQAPLTMRFSRQEYRSGLPFPTWGEFSSPRDGIPTQGLNLPLLHLLYYGQVDSLAPPAAAAKSLHLCPTLCSPMDCSPSGSSVHGIVQARILEQTAMPSSKSPQIPILGGGYLSILIPSVVFNYFLPEGHPDFCK